MGNLELLNQSINNLNGSVCNLTDKLHSFELATVERLTQGDNIFKQQNEQIKDTGQIVHEMQLSQISLVNLLSGLTKQTRYQWIVIGVISLIILSIIVNPEYSGVLRAFFSLFTRVFG